ncbi:hypothetical protein SAMN05444161_9006 [Rhizobiales bacterium GAS191]|nr:hypothetical protein SAMN05444161_9006 [Rhizobiales bacterium GAS191]
MWSGASVLHRVNRVSATAVVSAKMKDESEFRSYIVTVVIDHSCGLVSYEADLRDPGGSKKSHIALSAGRPDLCLAVRDRFLKTSLYAEKARELGWPIRDWKGRLIRFN